MLKNLSYYAVRIALVLFLSLASTVACVMEVRAAKTVDVTITAQPSGLFAPTNFDAVTINDNKITCTWVSNIFAATTMVRAKTGSYPVDATDGYLVYNGAGNSANDLTVSLDDTATNIFYRAWSVDGVGNLSPDYAQDNTGGVGMTLIALLGFALIMSWIALRNRSYWFLATIASAVWAFDLALWTTGVIRPATVTAGTPADQIYVYISWGLIVLFFVMPMFVEEEGAKGMGRFRMPFVSKEDDDEQRQARYRPTYQERTADYRQRASDAMRGIRR